jgi:hypothetical protein
MKAPPAKTRRSSVAARFRGEIEAAEAEGAARKNLTLKLTLGDAHQLKRDPLVALADISFADGTMWFLGVKVQQGGVPESALERPAAK